MKIFITSSKRLISYAIIFLVMAAVVLSIVQMRNQGASAVYAVQKELPIYSVERSDNNMAVTINCAWGDQDIDSILNTLKQNNAKATFFIVGDFAEKYPDRIKQMVAAGHEIACHSYQHGHMGAMSKEKIVEDLDKNKKLLSSLSGKEVNLFRAPYGEYNDLLIKTVKEKGYYPIQWSIDSLDWKPEITMEQIKSRIEKNVKPGSIILFHNDTKHTAAVLDSVLKIIKAKELVPVTASEVIYMDNYMIESDGRQVKKADNTEESPTVAPTGAVKKAE